MLTKSTGTQSQPVETNQRRTGSILFSLICDLELQFLGQPRPRMSVAKLATPTLASPASIPSLSLGRPPPWCCLQPQSGRVSVLVHRARQQRFCTSNLHLIVTKAQFFSWTDGDDKLESDINVATFLFFLNGKVHKDSEIHSIVGDFTKRP
jgi:hypothetical protein